jgi:hypothetical protein
MLFLFGLKDRALQKICSTARNKFKATIARNATYSFLIACTGLRIAALRL